jgi:hypothetical protein
LLRHRIVVHAPLEDVVRALRKTSFVSAEVTDTDRGLLHLQDAVGLLRGHDTRTEIALTDAGVDGGHVANLLDALRALDLEAEHRQVD